MKFSLATTLALSAAAPTAAYTVGGGYGRFVSPRGRARADRAARRCDPNQQNNRCVDRAFEDLAAELNEGRFRRRGRPNPFMQGMQLDEETLRQQQEWLNRAFGLAEDVAKGVASSPREEKEADEAIRQSKKFADSMFGFVKGVSPGSNYKSSARSEILQDDKELFEVALDVPGVKETDLEVTVEGTKDKTLVVSGKRIVGKGDDGIVQTKDFTKSFPLDPNSDINQMSASLENGVLVVSVPRLVVETTEIIKKIPISQVSEDSQAEKSETDSQPFQLELDVPGVQESNIDIEVKGDGEKTLTITAVREMGKDSNGNPLTKELSKSFQINELVATDKIVATLSNGVLTVSAPVDEKKAEKSVKRIIVNKSLDEESPSVGPTTDDAGDSADTGKEEA